MTFGELLDRYIREIGCTAKELADGAEISPGVLSRYRSGERAPSDRVAVAEKLAQALEKLAQQRQVTGDYAAAQIRRALEESLAKKDCGAMLVGNLNALIRTLDIRVSSMAKYINYDASFLSRIRQGQRLPAEPADFAHAVAGYVAKTYLTETGKALLLELLRCAEEELSDEGSCQLAVECWLTSNAAGSTDSVQNFLQKLNDFDLNEYIRTIHFDTMKVPSVPFQLPTSRSYFGLREMMESELDFLKATVLSRSTEPVIFYSDMPMEEMSRDPEFPKKWMYGMALMLKKGLKLNMIHNIDRPFAEMMLGLESWIPMYMTGQVNPYYLKNAPSNVFHHFLRVSGAAALEGEAIVGYHSKGKYYLTKNREELAYYRTRGECLLKRAQPLMDVYRGESERAYHAFLLADSYQEGSRRAILPSPPLYTMPENFLHRMLENHEVPEPDREKILQHAATQREVMDRILADSTVCDEIAELTREEFEQHPLALSLSGTFYDKDILYTYEEYLEHMMLTRKYAQEHIRYTCKTNMQQAFRNIRISIREGKWVKISKENAPAIHFIIHHPKMCDAIANMVIPVVE